MAYTPWSPYIPQDFDPATFGVPKGANVRSLQQQEDPNVGRNLWGWSSGQQSEDPNQGTSGQFTFDPRIPFVNPNATAGVYGPRGPGSNADLGSEQDVLGILGGQYQNKTLPYYVGSGSYEDPNQGGSPRPTTRTLTPQQQQYISLVNAGYTPLGKEWLDTTNSMSDVGNFFIGPTGQISMHAGTKGEIPMSLGEFSARHNPGSQIVTIGGQQFSKANPAGGYQTLGFGGPSAPWNDMAFLKGAGLLFGGAAAASGLGLFGGGEAAFGGGLSAELAAGGAVPWTSSIPGMGTAAGAGTVAGGVEGASDNLGFGDLSGVNFGPGSGVFSGPTGAGPIENAITSGTADPSFLSNLGSGAATPWWQTPTPPGGPGGTQPTSTGSPGGTPSPAPGGNALPSWLTQALQIGGPLVSGLFGAGQAREAAQTQQQGAQQANALISGAAGQARTDLMPWMQQGGNALKAVAGGLNLPGGGGGGIPSGLFTKPFGMADYTADPGYAFRLKEGLGAISNASTLSGGPNAGNALRAMENYASGSASQEYGAAYNRWNDYINNLFSRLNTVSGTGANAAARAGGIGMDAANLIGGNLTGAATAASAGQIGQANALTGGVANASNNYLLMQAIRAFQDRNRQQPTQQPTDLWANTPPDWSMNNPIDAGFGTDLFNVPGGFSGPA